MATNRILQLLRSNKTYASFDAAKTAVEALTGHLDGEILLARYGTGTPTGEGQSATGTEPFYTAIGVYDAGHTKWTVFKSSTEIDARIAELQTELDATQTGAGLGENGAYNAPTSGQAGYEILGGENAPANLKDAVMKVADYVYDTIQAMDYSLNVSGTGDSQTTLTTNDASKVVTAVNQTDGKIAAGTTNVISLELDGYQKGNNTGYIADGDTLQIAFSKLENATSTGVKLSGKSDNQITRLENQNPATDDGLYSHVELVAITGQDLTDLGTNVREAYKLQANGADITTSAPIKIYKDSSLKEVYLGADTDTINATSGAITKNTVTDPQSMNFAYQLADGTYELVKIDVSKFLTESEFGDGLSVSGGVVSVAPGNGIELTGTTPNRLVAVKAYDGITVDVNGVGVNVGNGLEIDSTSKAVNVKIDAASEKDSQNTDFLTVGAGGVKINGIKDEIDRKIAALDGTAVASSATNLETAPTTDFNVLASVVEVDGVIKSTTESNGSTAVTLKKVAATGAAADVSYDNTTAQMADSPATVQAAIDKLDRRIDALGTDALESVTSANAGIAVGTKSNHSQALTLTLDGTTQGNGHENTGTDNALTITDYGLFLSTTWDCGVY